ncbi:MAG: hypothetical protein A2162_05285 [Deltaproteobacteria bacterium RBG_13_52_11b]|nr:MAG: hypothetical protein A2162_05285 [Deltaproteobacteria bacterium RBG_13_52_11b]
MFWGKKSAKEEGKLSGPREIPGPVQNYLVAEKKMDLDLVKLLKAVDRKSTTGATLNIRVFDNSEAIAKKVQVKDYTSLEECPDLIIYEGWFDQGAKQVKLEEKKKANWDTPILTQDEIQHKIEALKEPGDTVFFYTARGGKHGGPLGMGASVIELNPNYPGKKQKKYILYTADVIDMQPVGKGDKLFDSDKPKDIARWVKDAHHKRMY